jgi:MFS family permease
MSILHVLVQVLVVIVGSSHDTSTCFCFAFSVKAIRGSRHECHNQQRFPNTGMACNKNAVGEDAKNDDDDLVFGSVPRKTVFYPLALLLASQLLLFIGVGAVIPTIPLYGKEIGLSQATNGIVISAPAVALLVLANQSGKYADQARKPAMILGMAFIVLSDLGTAMASSLPTLLVARLGLGAGRGISEAGERGMVADLVNQVPTWRGRVLAAQQSMIAVGIAIGAPLGGLIVEQYGPRSAFLCVSVAAFVSLILYLFLPETTGTTTTAFVPGKETNNIDFMTYKTKDPPTSIGDITDNNNDNNNTNNKGMVVEWSTLLQDNQWRGLALCQSGATFGFAAKIASIPILAADTLPGGALAAGALLSAAGLSGLVGAPLGGYITDRRGAKFVAIISGIVGGLALIGIPLALSPAASADNASAFSWLQDHLYNNIIYINNQAGMGSNGLAFCVLVIVWSTSVAAQGPAMTALAQELAPTGSEATSMALPRAAGDGTYIVAPFLLGIVADKASLALGMPGVECAVAGTASLLGAVALAFLGRSRSHS